MIYSLVKGCQGRSSSFLSGVLLRIDEAIRQERLHDDELLLKPSVSAESFELHLGSASAVRRFRCAVSPLNHLLSPLLTFITRLKHGKYMEIV